jgi:AcrR family transcriptional regulator
MERTAPGRSEIDRLRTGPDYENGTASARTQDASSSPRQQGGRQEVPSPSVAETSTRDRLLLAAAKLLSAANGGEVSTRAICELAGTQAPTLYHHFGSKQALLDSVVSHGFREFLHDRHTRHTGVPDDPIAAIREGWDTHVAFGLAHPTFYAHVYGNVQPGVPCGVVGEVKSMVLTTITPAAAQGRLTVTPEAAADEIVAASSGVILTLITQPSEHVDLALSSRVREAVLQDIAPTSSASAHNKLPTTQAAASRLLQALSTKCPPLSPTEAALFRDWLARISSNGPHPDLPPDA